jgi:hypothetical protein
MSRRRLSPAEPTRESARPECRSPCSRSVLPPTRAQPARASPVGRPSTIALSGGSAQSSGSERPRWDLWPRGRGLRRHKGVHGAVPGEGEDGSFSARGCREQVAAGRRNVLGDQDRGPNAGRVGIELRHDGAIESRLRRRRDHLSGDLRAHPGGSSRPTASARWCSGQ